MLQIIINMVLRCGHRRLTRPITPRGGGPSYVACLDCGRQLHYDLQTMRVGELIEAN
jgi:DNA-directed RNA polymerase subunit RPC12/RpoP